MQKLELGVVRYEIVKIWWFSTTSGVTCPFDFPAVVRHPQTDGQTLRDQQMMIPIREAILSDYQFLKLVQGLNFAG